MGRLTTHVLDTVQGRPAGGLAIQLFRLDGGQPTLLKSVRTNADGRVDGPLLEGAEFTVGRYRLVFDVEAYFKAAGVKTPEPPFLSQVPLDFGIASPEQHYHVPLLVSPWSYSTYRGS